MIGTVIGLISGFVGGRTDNAVMRVMDVLLAFPALLLAIAIVTARGWACSTPCWRCRW